MSATGPKLVIAGATLSTELSYGSYQASNCIDGNNGTMCHSDNTGSGGQYLRLDLGDNSGFPIRTVRIYNRLQDCCTERLANHQIWVGDNADDWSSNALCSETDVDDGPQTLVTHTIADDQSPLCSGRFVFVVLPGDARTLNLMEVEVYGFPGTHIHPSSLVCFVYV